MNRSCLECGASVPTRVKGCGGNQPGFCSDACRSKRKTKTHRQWVDTHSDQKKSVDSCYRKKRKETHADYFRQYYAKHKEQRKQESLEWYRENSEYALERQRAYDAKHPEQVRANGRRNANKRRAITKHVFVETVDPRTVFERDKSICGICRELVEMTSPWEVDHIVPISKGGAHCYANVQLTHRKCNRSKAARLPKGQPTLFQVVA